MMMAAVPDFVMSSPDSLTSPNSWR